MLGFYSLQKHVLYSVLGRKTFCLLIFEESVWDRISRAAQMRIGNSYCRSTTDYQGWKFAHQFSERSARFLQKMSEWAIC